ncbi:glycoside hydrolase family 32 protein [Hymenobacter sp. HSC-4F20]|uniref:glycoside hydrolase family 32 protein n=1 Tax=Hymenobacter sp. HSC-4F20 TaxID=2864135 RepID=UPI001C72CCB1|nr:glycoside hydrolase family 32 protein [Hymenobacter sp. HSC-4F20]MBX0290449.1 glycoside hydrolase family 32 protein [Hymenobacter sp. HSC-4F20]
MKKTYLLAFSLASLTALGQTQPAAPLPPATPQYRPAYHFSPAKMWMNDPNGMVYYQGTYHLFFQHYPEALVWGPMHWGHATSQDLVTWQEQPIALYPDKLGWIFSGSAVIDENNTAGFGKNAMVAIFTHHNDPEEKKKTNKHQYQSLAYSLDEGKTWTKYEGNPVLPNPGIQDFRDPKVNWNTVAKQWVMTLATKDRITFYSSPNLKQWAKRSEFGQKLGAHGGVWECPDLFPLTLNGKTYWVLLVSINPGGPNGGSATQYFVGQFDGKTFTPTTTTQKWVDWGKDNYAGVTWGNTGARKIFLGWMSNWEYANQVPTSPWRNAMTVPRDLALRQVGSEIYLTSQPAKEVVGALQAPQILKNLTVKSELNLTDKIKNPAQQFQLNLSTRQLQDMAVVLSNAGGEEVVIGYDKRANQYYIDRTKAGLSSFGSTFAGRHPAPRLAAGPAADMTLLFDAASVELFADGGLTTMTEIFFPKQPFTQLKLRSAAGLTVDALTYAKVGSMVK